MMFLHETHKGKSHWQNKQLDTQLAWVNPIFF